MKLATQRMKQMKWASQPMNQSVPLSTCVRQRPMLMMHDVYAGTQL